jgi:hypothetical protein
MRTLFFDPSITKYKLFLSCLFRFIESSVNEMKQKSDVSFSNSIQASEAKRGDISPYSDNSYSKGGEVPVKICGQHLFESLTSTR